MPADRQLLQQVATEVVSDDAVVEHLGTGGFASTFKVTSGEEVYALKVVDSAQSEVERTARELDALQRVEHANVVGYQGTGVVSHDGNEYRWLAMDYIEGRTLGRVLAEGATFDLPRAVEVIRQAISGAAALWAVGTAHRDLSPNNILLTPSDQVVIVDLGMARHLDDRTITVLPTPGTPGWMSPEQVSLNPTHGDWRSDQYVLGLLAYRLITGVDPFTCRSVFEAWRAPAEQTPRPARDLNPLVPATLSDLLAKMLSRQPHRRYLQPAVLGAELERIAASLVIPEHSLDTAPRFLLAVGTKKSYATEDFLKSLDPDGVVVEAQVRGRIGEFVGSDAPLDCHQSIDPFSYLSRSPVQVRPSFYRALPYGAGAPVTGFVDDAARRAFCRSVLDYQLQLAVKTVMAPYFYASSGELSWIEESLRCAAVTDELLEERAAEREGQLEPIWTTVAVAASWLSQEQARDELMTALTSQPIETLHLLVHTQQSSSAPLSDVGTLKGLADLIAVMREAGVPVVLGRRSSEGLLGLALGYAGWTVGVSGVQQNMTPHPEAEASGGRGYDRIYVPQLLTAVTTPTYRQFVDVAPERVGLDTPYAHELLAENPTLEELSTEQRILLLQHNVIAMRCQARRLAESAPASRVSHMREWVHTARGTFGVLPTVAGPGESATFLDAWSSVL